MTSKKVLEGQVANTCVDIGTHGLMTLDGEYIPPHRIEKIKINEVD
jgi:uncharacterized protein (UPF0248 family)